MKVEFKRSILFMVVVFGVMGLSGCARIVCSSKGWDFEPLHYHASVNGSIKLNKEQKIWIREIGMDSLTVLMNTKDTYHLQKDVVISKLSIKKRRLFFHWSGSCWCDENKVKLEINLILNCLFQSRNQARVCCG